MKNIANVILLGGLIMIATNSQAEAILFKDKAGRILTVTDVRSVSEAVSWEVTTNSPVPDEARKLHEMGRTAGQKGDHSAALKYFGKAAMLAPDWPYPIYDAAFAYLLANNAAKALAHYRRVLQMSPRGFFTAIAAADALEKEQSGKLPPGTYMHYVSLEWQSDAKKKAEAIIALNSKVPEFAPGWKARATIDATERDRLEAIENGLKADPDIETRGFLLINKALILSNKGKKNDAITILGELALDPGSPLSIEIIAKKIISSFL
jgi:tetratricopeptide (TPR) repeat protein